MKELQKYCDVTLCSPGNFNFILYLCYHLQDKKEAELSEHLVSIPNSAAVYSITM